MIQFSCPSCARVYTVADEFAGKKTRCRKCDTKLRVPMHTLPTVLPSKSTMLFDCLVCGRSMSRKAEACPHCGNPNEWVHPEMQRFANHLDEIGKRYPSLEYEGNRLSLVAWVEKPSIGSTIAGLVSSVGFLTPLSLSGAAWMVGLSLAQGVAASTLAQLDPNKFQIFCINFEAAPPEWDCTDEEFWRTLIQFFRVIDQGIS